MMQCHLELWFSGFIMPIKGDSPGHVYVIEDALCRFPMLQAGVYTRVDAGDVIFALTGDLPIALDTALRAQVLAVDHAP